MIIDPGGGSGLSGDFSYIPGKNQHYMISNSMGRITDLNLQENVDLGVDVWTAADFSVDSSGYLKAIAGNRIIKSPTDQSEITSLISQPSCPNIPLDGFSLRFSQISGGGVFVGDSVNYFGNTLEYIKKPESYMINFDMISEKYFFDYMHWQGVTGNTIIGQMLNVYFTSTIDDYLRGVQNYESSAHGLLVTAIDGKIYLADGTSLVNIDLYFSSYNYYQQLMTPRYITENGYCVFESAVSGAGISCYIGGAETFTNTNIASTHNANYGYHTEKGLEASYSYTSVPIGGDPILLGLDNSYIDIAWLNYGGSPHCFLVQLRSIPNISSAVSLLNKIPIGNGFYLSGAKFDSLITPSGQTYTIPFQTDIDAPVPMPIKKPIEDASYIYALTGYGDIAVIKKSDGSSRIVPQTGGVRNLNLSECDDIQKFKQDIATYLGV